MKLLNTNEVINLVNNYKFKKIHIHHTLKPNHSNFNGSNHIQLNQNMKNYHVNTNGWSDIGQHLTLYPDGKWVTGRPLNKTPASISGHNNGALCIEMIGNFDVGNDKLEGKQKDSIMLLVNNFGNKYGFHNVMFHNEASSKSCPGTSINKSKFVSDARNININVESDPDLLYRVQVGAYSKKDNADNMLKKLKSKGFDGFITEVDLEIKPDYKEYSNGNLYIQETLPEKCYVGFARGRNLKQLDVVGVNGTWQNNSEVHLERSIWGLLANKYGAIGPNSYQNSPKQELKRGTMVYYEDGTLDIIRVNNLNEIKKPIIWAIGGGSLIPNLEASEKFANDIFRNTHHTAVGFKDGRVYQIVTTKHCTMSVFQSWVKSLNLEKAIFLDGGGSSQMNTKSGKGLYSSRPLASGLFIKGV